MCGNSVVEKIYFAPVTTLLLLLLLLLLLVSNRNLKSNTIFLNSLITLCFFDSVSVSASAFVVFSQIEEIEAKSRRLLADLLRFIVNIIVIIIIIKLPTNCCGDSIQWWFLNKSEKYLYICINIERKKHSKMHARELNVKSYCYFAEWCLMKFNTFLPSSLSCLCSFDLSFSRPLFMTAIRHLPFAICRLFR